MILFSLLLLLLLTFYFQLTKTVTFYIWKSYVAQKVKSSERDRLGKFEQIHKLMLICSESQRKTSQKIQIFYAVHWPKWISHAANIFHKNGRDNIRKCKFDFNFEFKQRFDLFFLNPLWNNFVSCKVKLAVSLNFDLFCLFCGIFS